MVITERDIFCKAALVVDQMTVSPVLAQEGHKGVALSPWGSDPPRSSMWLPQPAGKG